MPPRKYGGTELVISNLTEGLVRRQHHVDLFASGDSKTRAKLRPTISSAIRVQPLAQDAKTRESLKYLTLGKLLQLLETDQYDVIHNHIGWRFLPFCHLFHMPVVTTLHGPLDITYQQIIFNQYRDLPYVSISNSQRKPMKHLHFIATVYNGIDINKFDYNDRPSKYVAFLGRMSPEKGPKQAIEFAKAAGLTLKMAAKIDVNDRDYYEKEIEPLIDGKQIQYIGEVDHRGKNQLLKNALALVAFIQWEEPFGLFLVEAMATGTPVIATKHGSVLELVKDGETGFIINNVSEAVQVWKNIEKIARAACRKHVEDNFTVEKMVDGYEKVYASLIKKIL